jgi:hypothetical protein
VLGGDAADDECRHWQHQSCQILAGQPEFVQAVYAVFDPGQLNPENCYETQLMPDPTTVSGGMPLPDIWASVFDTQ